MAESCRRGKLIGEITQAEDYDLPNGTDGVYMPIVWMVQARGA